MALSTYADGLASSLGDHDVDGLLRASHAPIADQIAAKRSAWRIAVIAYALRVEAKLAAWVRKIGTS